MPKTDVERQNRLYLAYHDKAKELDRSPTPMERQSIRDEIDKQLKAERGNGTGGDPSDWRTFAITQKDLFAKKLEPLQFLVDGMLVSGLIGLGGKKKLYKTFLSLDICNKVASGADFLGRKVRQGKVIFMSFEDGEIRLKDRLQKLQADPNLPILYLTKFAPLDSPEGQADFENMLRVETPAFVVIDTLASATSKELNENRSGDMAAQMNWLHGLTLAYKVTILVVMHHGKRSFSDVGFDIRGSSATPSATDTNCGLYKAGDGCYDFVIEGRDVPSTELRLCFDLDTWMFQLTGDAKDARRADSEARIIEAIEALDGEADAATIAIELGLSRIAVQNQCQRMRKDKLLDFKSVPSGKTKTKKIIYSLPETMVTSVTSITPLEPVKEVIEVSDVIVVSTVKDKEDNTVKEVREVTPVSVVNINTLPEELPVEVIKNLGNISGEGLHPCIKGKGGCALQSKYTKQPFACAYSQAKCPFFRGTE